MVLDRARFPRPKLCGDTLNPGTLALLERLGIGASVTARALPIRGMRLTGPGGASVEGVYGRGFLGASLSRCEFDQRLLREALAAGADFRPAVRVTAARVTGSRVTGVNAAGTGGSAYAFDAAVTIAADGRRSALAFPLGLAVHPRAPRRWAIGAYYQDVVGLGDLGEMHVRGDHYVGVAPLPGGLVNAILVVPRHVAAGARVPAAQLLDDVLHRDPALRDRFLAARRIGRPTVLGPLAVDAPAPGMAGLLLAGDAAGFVDPITGDGMRFAIEGGILAAAAALDALAGGWPGVVDRLAGARRVAFREKWRFNRAVRRLTGSPAAVRLLARIAPALPPLLAWAVRVAGDCREASAT